MLDSIMCLLNVNETCIKGRFANTGTIHKIARKANKCWAAESCGREPACAGLRRSCGSDQSTRCLLGMMVYSLYSGLPKPVNHEFVVRVELAVQSREPRLLPAILTLRTTVAPEPCSHRQGQQLCKPGLIKWEACSSGRD